MSYSVGQVAQFSGLTVRALHHYDQIGLLCPGERTRAGHRKYTDRDLDRLQRILFYRELGFPLNEVATLLDDPEADSYEHLRRRHRLLNERIAKLQEMAEAVRRNMEAQTMGIRLTPREKFEIFGDFDPDAYTSEVEQRWGHTEAYQESQRRTGSYKKSDWRRLMAEHDGISRRLADLMANGSPATSAEAMDLAEAHRAWINDHSYGCGTRMHRNLADMYVADARFTATYDNVAPGLAAYLREAIHANADRRDASREDG